MIEKKQPPHLRQPRKWRPRQDGKCCIECEKPFRRGDMVFEDCVVCIHEGCLQAYGITLKELGLR